MPRVSKATTKIEVDEGKPSKPKTIKKTVTEKPKKVLSSKTKTKSVKVSKIAPVEVTDTKTFIKEPEKTVSSEVSVSASSQGSDKTILIIGSIMLILGLGLGYAGSQLTAKPVAPTVIANQQDPPNVSQLVGQTAPDFTLTDIYGKSFTLSSYKGNKPVLLIIEATWCGFCKKELPDLKAFYEANKGTLEILSVANREDLATVKAYVEGSGIQHPWLPDVNGAVGQNLAFRGTPHHVLIGKDGVIKLVRPGFATRKDLDAMLPLI